ncbi:hypothetical protein V495_02101 [Pseudogymnoascus sp. VKM F-4514 (FW-929)]|nr:hypothetical protein V495_02101 [Pseudogymnoascus sp. VKM F-4514 (FW-929)]KFY58807.1 hypothetical protein V497_04656 [Pseudogymnoascus sp. VKM F-4516 (FW-969)]
MAHSKGKGRATNGLTSKPGVIGAVARFWQKTYAPDYVGVAVLVAAYIVLEFKTTPFHRLFDLGNIDIAYPHAEVERVPVSMMFLYGGGVPLIVMAIWLAISRAGIHKSHVTILSFFIGMLLTAVITDLIKNAVGRPRPDLISRCKAKAGTPLHTLVSWEVCTETDHHVLHDGWRSFPSGHSSFSFSGLGFLALFLSGQMHVFRREGDLARGLLALAPLLLAGWVAISRCEDYRHDVYDVTIGSALGMIIAHWSYRRFYPRQRNVNCDTPYASRTSAASGNGFSKVGDDEEAAVMHDGTGPTPHGFMG